MKKTMIIGIVSCSLLVACSNENQAETSTVSPKVSDVTKQTETANQQATIKPIDENKTTQQTEMANQQPIIEPIDENEFNNLTVSVSNMLNKINETMPNGTMSQFLALDQEIEQLENQVDVYEDQIEATYQAGQITADQFRTMEKNTEALENQLDQAEDTLETIFQIDNN